MQLAQLIDLKELKKLIDEGYVTERHHPTYPLRILNYSPKSQEIKVWSNTLSYCRGLVYEETSLQVLAIPFKKFWSYNDPSHPDTLPENLPKGVPAVYEKVDGSLGIGFFYKGKFVIATRGSFESDQAKWAQKWINEHIKEILIDPITDKLTLLFEIVMPEDRKVVQYDFSGLVLLGETDAEGRSFRPDPMCIKFLPGVKIAKQEYFWGTGFDLDELQKKDIENEEGYVAVWFNGTNTQRVKIKFETYKRLHRMYFQTTTDVIWQLMKEGKDLGEHLVGADPNIINWVLSVRDDINLKLSVYDSAAKSDFRFAMEFVNSQCDLDAPEKERRKAFALIATQKLFPGLLFLMYDGNIEKYEEKLWDAVRPKNIRFSKVGEDV